MKENKQIILPSKKYSTATAEDVSLRLDLDSSESLLRIGDRDIVLDVANLFDKERNENLNYKVFGKINMIFRNFYSGTSSYDYLSNTIYQLGIGETGNNNGWLSYNEFAFLRNDVYREINTPPSTSGLTSYTPQITTKGSVEHTNITPITAPYHNWNLYLSYVYSSDSGHTMTYTLSGATSPITFVAGNGIPFRVDSTTDPNYHILTSPVEHGFEQGDHILLSGGTTTHNDFTGSTFYVNVVGNEMFNSKKYVIKLIKSQFLTGKTINGQTLVLGKRVSDIKYSGSTSQYYVQKLKTLTKESDYILDLVGFESPIFENEKKLQYESFDGTNDVYVERNRPESVLYDFKEPIVLSGITNNLGFTPTEVYLTTIFRNGNGYFNYPPKVGFKFNFHDTWIDKHFDGDSSKETSLSGQTFTRDSITFISGNTIPIGTSGFTGAFVEFNKKDMKERIICNSYHKITSPIHLFDHGQDDGNIYSGATSGNTFGIYYQPFHKIKLRELSPYVESAKTSDIYNLPENTIFDQDEKIWRWRDVYNHGYIDDKGYGTDFPFVNGQHYVKNNFNFYLRNELHYINKSDGLIGFDDIINRDKNTIC